MMKTFHKEKELKKTKKMGSIKEMTDLLKTIIQIEVELEVIRIITAEFSQEIMKN